MLLARGLVVALAAASPRRRPRSTRRSDRARQRHPCTVEAFHYSQIWHIVAHTDIDPFGEEYVTSQHLNSTQTDGFGLESGRQYLGHQIGNTTDHPFNAAHSVTAVAQFHVIDTGKATTSYQPRRCTRR